MIISHWAQGARSTRKLRASSSSNVQLKRWKLRALTFYTVRRSPKCRWAGHYRRHLRRRFVFRTPALPRPEKSLVLAGVQGKAGIRAVARRMRRFFGPHGGAVRQDVLVATDVDFESNDDDYAAWAAYRQAGKRKEEGGRVWGDEKAIEWRGRRYPQAY